MTVIKTIAMAVELPRDRGLQPHMTGEAAKPLPVLLPEPRTMLLTFDRTAGGLAVTSIEPDYDLLVDDAFHSTGRLSGGEIPVDRINRLLGSDLAGGSVNWTATGSGVSIGTDLTPDWTLEGGHTAYLASAAGPGEEPVAAVFQCPYEGSGISVTPGTVYTFQAVFGVHRCRASLRFVFTDAGGAEVKALEQPLTVTGLGGRGLDGYTLRHFSAKAPHLAQRLRIEIVKSKTLDGDDSFLFFTRPALCRSPRVTNYQYLVKELPDEAAIGFFDSPAEVIYSGRIPLPDEVLDGGWHKVGVRNRRTGESQSIPVALPESILAGARILGFEGSVLVAHIDVPAGWSNPVTISLWIDETPLEENFRTEPGGSLRIPLPGAYCDGRPHTFALRLGKSGQLLGQFAALGPLSITPWSVLQKHAGSPLPGQLAPLAALRYASLAAGGGPRAAGGPSLTELHDILLQGFGLPRKAFRPLPFPQVTAPDVSIVVPVHNQFDVTYVCLASLLFAASRASFEVIVVDDGSGDTTRDLADIAPGVRVVRNATAQGFVGACNAGAAAARGKYIVFLNNDTEPTAWWLDELIFVFDNFDGVGLAGSKLLYGDGVLQEAGGIVWDSGDPWNYGHRANAADPRFNYTRIADYVSGAALMIPARLWNELGGFSEDFMPAYFEDTDLAFKVKNAGYKVVFAPLSQVVHYEGLSNGTDHTAATGLKRFQEVNRPKFKRKWQALFAGNGKLGTDADLHKDRGIARRVLFIDVEFPHIDRDAGSYAALQEIRLFQGMGCKVTFAPLNMAYLGRYTSDLQRLGVECIHAPFHASVAAFLKARGSEFDLVYITRFGVAEQIIAQVNQHAPQARTVVNVADLHFLRQLREARRSADPAKLQDALATRTAELAALSRAELVLSYSDVEQVVINSHLSHGPKTGIVPWVVDPVPVRSGFAERRDVAFLGGFGHAPNAEAVKFFVSDVMPLLRHRLPGCRFRIYGSNVPPDIAALASDDVVIEGYVRDVAEIFDTCRVFVAPLLTGAGVKGKVMDCMAAGIPSVLSPVAAEGVGLREGIDAIIARSPAQWADGIVKLYSDEAAWQAMSSSVQALAAEKCGFARGMAALSDALAAIEFFLAPDKRALRVTSTRPVSPVAPPPVAGKLIAARNPLAL